MGGSGALTVALWQIFRFTNKIFHWNYRLIYFLLIFGMQGGYADFNKGGYLIIDNL